MSDLQYGEATLEKVNFTGGFPEHKDLAPSILFTVLYGLTIPVLIWRIASPKHRSILLFRPSMFVGARIASLIIRAVMAEGTYSLGLLIAELVLISVGFLFLIEPLITAWYRHVCRDIHKSQRPGWLNPVKWFFYFLILVAIVLAVVSGAIVSKAFYETNGPQKILDLREASYVISLFLVVGLLACLIATSIHFDLPLMRSAYLAIPMACLVIVAAYRVAQTFDSNPSSAGRSKAAFWVLQITFEFIAYMFMLAVSMPEWFPKVSDGEPGSTAGAHTETKGNQPMSQMENGQAGPRTGAQPGLKKRPIWAKGLITRHFFKDKYYD